MKTASDFMVGAQTFGSGDQSSADRVERIAGLCTPAYAARLRAATARRADRDFERLNAAGQRQRATADSSAVATRSPGHLVTVVLYRVKITPTPAGSPTTSPLQRARVELDLVDGRWLVSTHGSV